MFIFAAFKGSRGQRQTSQLAESSSFGMSDSEAVVGGKSKYTDFREIRYECHATVFHCELIQYLRMMPRKYM